MYAERETEKSGNLRGMVRVLTNEEGTLRRLPWEIMQLALERAGEGVGFLTARGEMIEANAAFRRFLAMTAKDAPGTSLERLLATPLPDEVWKKGEAQLNQAVTNWLGADLWLDLHPLGERMDDCWLVLLRQGRDRQLADQLELAQRRLDLLEKQAEQQWVPDRWYQTESREKQMLRQLKAGSAFEKFIGVSQVVIDTLNMAAKASRVQSTILISGDSGTGKEVLAEGIHLASPRNGGPFIKVNCAALSLQLLESELFGHEKGAFTGAIRRKQGKFELADGGTLFLDEVGEMDPAMQSKLLRVLQTSSFERVGGETTLTVNVRIIAATNRNLAEMVQRGDFREDLYYRFNVIPLELVALRERREDIPLLVDHFLRYFNRAFGQEVMGISQDAMERLLAYAWPGNVRELRNVVERLVALSDDKYISIGDLPSHIALPEKKAQVEAPGLLKDGEIFPLEQYEKEIIREALSRYGSYTAAGKALGITHKTVAAKAQKYGLEKQ